MSIGGWLMGFGVAWAAPEITNEQLTEDVELPEISDADIDIINGEAADEDLFPMTGGMLLDATVVIPGFGTFPLQSVICSSTLIAPDVVLLAAHCVDDNILTGGFGSIEDAKRYWTRQADLTEWDGSHIGPALPSDAVEVLDFVIHPGWTIDIGLGLSENSDIALLFLEEPVLDVDFAYLPTKKEGRKLEEGDEVWIVGWGQQIATGPGDAPPAGSYASKQAGKSFIAEINEFEIKIGEVESDVRKCHGDSGGPTFRSFGPAPVAPKLVGVTSHSYDLSDCNETGGVDTRVDFYLDWLDETLTSYCEDGTRSWCDEPGIPVAPTSFAAAGESFSQGTSPKKKGCMTVFPPSVAVAILGAVMIRRRRIS